ncbi:MAG: hypothetical protein ACUVS3_10110 [Thermodesulfobacteriota bacterium]
MNGSLNQQRMPSGCREGASSRKGDIGPGALYERGLKGEGFKTPMGAWA